MRYRRFVFIKGLFYKLAAAFGKPVTHVESPFAVFPALVSIDTQGHIALGANHFHQFLVFVEAHFYFNHFIRRGLIDFLVYNLRCVDGDGKRSVGAVVGVESPDFVPRLPHDLPSRSCRAMSTDAFAARLSGATESI